MELIFKIMSIKNILRIISVISILLFAVLWIANKFVEQHELINPDVRSFLVLVYLFSSMWYYRLLLQEKETRIRDLEEKLLKKS